MHDRPDFQLRIFYDGSCPVCAAEVKRYGRNDAAGRLILVDISADGFDPAAFGIPLTEFMYQLHAMDRSGRVYRGVESFWAIWQAFPTSIPLGLAGYLITLPLLNPLARVCYRMFAAIRGYLPQRRSSCHGGSCRVDLQ